MQISIKKFKKTYNEKLIIENLDIEFESNQIACILGPSGCGKTTLLNYICGLVNSESGEKEGVNTDSISYLFQEPRLLPWKTVYDNIAFVLKGKYDKNKMGEVIESHLDLVGMTEFKDYYPSHLSGGMKQRVAIARAFSYPSEILLMDEPFKGIDPKLKAELMKSFIELWEKDKRTVVFVTHEIDEAIILGNRIYIMSNRPAKITHVFDNYTKEINYISKNDDISDFKKRIGNALDI